MKTLIAFLAFVVVFAEGGDADPVQAYFTRVRDVAIASPGRQNYLVIDAAIWAHARADLADLRLYDGSTQVPYELKSEQAGVLSQESEVKILNLAKRGDHTEFDLDVAPVTEYNRIHLTLDRKDFLVSAFVEGRDALTDGTAAPWPSPSTLFDFSRENLGSNSTITMPTWSFRYVHVRLSPGILPAEVKKATVARFQEREAQWVRAGTCAAATQEKRSSVIKCEVPAGTPVERVRFDLPPGRVNFRRIVTVADEQGTQVATGSISRIRITRGGTTVDSEELAVPLFADRTGPFTVTIDNGDDPPLTFSAVEAQAMQRRLYFDPQGKTSLKLYYGDEKLTPPVYDYAKFFREDAAAVQAALGPETQNTAYTGRPDERPWSERHKAILWVAMLAAVGLLTLLAVRGLRAGTEA